MRIRFKKIGGGNLRTHSQLSNDPLESDIQKAIVDYLRLRHVYVSVTDSSRSFGRDGLPRRSKVDTSHPDLSCVLPVLVGDRIIGLALFIECKRKNGATKVGQKERLLELAEAGALCILARSTDEVKRVIDIFMNKPFSYDAYDKEVELLKLNLSDRRTKSVRTALATRSTPNDTKQ